MEGSVIRSAVSMDSPRGGSISLREEQLAAEVQRLQRKNTLLEKGRVVLEEQVELYREEIASKNCKIQQLALQLAARHTPSPLPPPTMHHPTPTPPTDLILIEQQEQLAMASDALKSQRMRLEELQEQNRQLREEMANSSAMVRQLKESSRAQFSYQRAQLDALEQELHLKHQQIAAARILADSLAQKESAKWQKIVEGLKEQLKLAQQDTKNVVLRQQDYAQERQQLKQKNESLLEQIEGLNNTVTFLQGLLEEAKGAFIDAQLQQQEQLQREEREKKEYRKRNQLLKTQIKTLKSNSDSASTYDPSNKSIRTASTVSVTPFRVSSCRHKLNAQP